MVEGSKSSAKLHDKCMIPTTCSSHQREYRSSLHTVVSPISMYKMYAFYFLDSPSGGSQNIIMSMHENIELIKVQTHSDRVIDNLSNPKC